MKGWLLLLSLALVFAGTTCYAESSAFGDDDEWEEVVVKRRKKRTTVAPAPAAAAVVVVAPVAAPTVIEEEEVVSDEPPPPPEPPAADAAEPRRLVRYFCKAWKDKDYERLWWAMSPEYRSEVSLKKFKKLFVSDAELNGGLVDENILGRRLPHRRLALYT